jgi:glycosyltransferase involved in cell wall biosynthesis
LQENEPLISVIIPVYNGDNYLAEAIESALAQTYEPAEVIVVDDGSTDTSAEIARGFSPRVSYCYQTNHGLGASRNRGTDEARGDFLTFLDADDIWVSDKLNRQMAAFKTDPTLDMVFGYVQQFVSPELSGSTKVKLDRDRETMPGYIASTLMVKEESFSRVGRFATNWRVGEFIDWYLKAKEIGLKSTMLPGVVLKRRLHTENMGIRERDSRTDYVRILKASLDRRREKNPQ